MLLFDTTILKSERLISPRVGGAVLTEFAHVIDRNRRSSDLLGRCGGEELVFIAPATDKEDAAQLDERLRAVVEEHHFPPAGKTTASFGAAVFQGEDSIDALIKKANVNLYEVNLAPG